jgi:hypothetical protein
LKWNLFPRSDNDWLTKGQSEIIKKQPLRLPSSHGRSFISRRILCAVGDFN